MLADLISSKTRIKLLLKFFLNSKNAAHLRGLAEEFDESTNAVRVELNRLESAKMLDAYVQGNKKIYRANTAHPLFREIQQIVRKHLGIDQLILTVIGRLGNVDKVYLTGPFAAGQDSPVIDLLIIGNIQLDYLIQLIAKAETLLNRKIRYLHYPSLLWHEHMIDQMDGHPLLIWDNNGEL